MNASAYLKGLGWRGEGFSLDTSDRGLAKPLLVQHKIDLTGLGTKKNDFSNQWWLSSFDESLKTIANTNTTQRIVPPIPKQSGLYSNFVKAETLQSTIEPDEIVNFTERPSEGRAEQTKMSMSTIPVGFVLGETSANSTFTQPTITTREKRGKKRKHDEGTSVVVQPSSFAVDEPPLKAKKEEKSKKERQEDGQDDPASNSLISAEAVSKVKKEKRSKSNKQPTKYLYLDTTAVPSNIEPVAVPNTAQELSKKEKKSKSKKSDDLIDNSASTSSTFVEIQDPKTHSTGLIHQIDGAPNSAHAVQDTAPSFISFADGSDAPQAKKVKKQKVTSESSGTKPDISSAMALGMPDAKGIPTIHPKTGQPLSKKARKIIAKKQSKLAMKNGRAEVRARRQAKKAERAKQAAAKKKAAGEKPPVMKEKKGDKYARQKAIRVAKREAKARFASGTGTGANSMPMG